MCEGDCRGKLNCSECSPNWICGKCEQETLENPGELIRWHHRTCAKREPELRQRIIENINNELSHGGHPDGLAENYKNIILNS